ncbi:hypothetical protein O0L34_g14713 [Tuta absoluta]|nr:hypothetical protein O0L34_g14713 [Tuta absoluta]
MEVEEETSDDELPSISLSQDSSTREVVMPSARDVAKERDRERRTELELQRLRETHSPPAGAAGGGGGPGGGPPPPRSDSSGSEGEAALAAAVRALRVLPASAPRAAHASVARRLLALLPAPPHALHQYSAAFADDASTTVLHKLINKMVHAIGCALTCSYNAFTEDELITSAGVVCAACLALPGPAPAPLARRTLHCALQRAQSHAAVSVRLASLAAAAASDGSNSVLIASKALLALSDAARGGGPLADLLAALLVRHALTLLTPPDSPHYQQLGAGVTARAMQESSPSEPLSARELHELLTCSSGGWKRLAPPTRHVALKLVSRALRASETAATGASETADRARVLAAIAQPQQADKQHPDYLKVVVAASTLQLLLRAPATQT